HLTVHIVADNYADQFYFVPVVAGATFLGGHIEPVRQLGEIIEWANGYTHPDGFIYPPVQHTRQMTGRKRSRRVPGSERGALLHQLPPTHTIHLSSENRSPDALRNSDAGFLIHFFAFLYGRRA